MLFCDIRISVKSVSNFLYFVAIETDVSHHFSSYWLGVGGVTLRK